MGTVSQWPTSTKRDGMFAHLFTLTLPFYLCAFLGLVVMITDEALWGN